MIYHSEPFNGDMITEGYYFKKGRKRKGYSDNKFFHEGN